jgi:hypothetical protein
LLSRCAELVRKQRESKKSGAKAPGLFQLSPPPMGSPQVIPLMSC